MRFRLSSSRQPYRRGGLKIGPRHAPSLLEPGASLEPDQVLALLRDPVVTIAVNEGEDEDGWRSFSEGERAEQADSLVTILRAQELAIDQEGLDDRIGELLAGADLSASEAMDVSQAIERVATARAVESDMQLKAYARASEFAEDDGATAQGGTEGPAQPPVEPAADEVEPVAAKGAAPKAAAGRQPRKASGKPGTKQG